MFPVEIWEKILKEVDASSLIRLRSVNTIWNILIDKILKESDAWCRQCEKDVPKQYWLILLENSFLSTKLYSRTNLQYHNLRCNYKIWMTIYRAWTKWQNVHNINILSTDEFTPIPKHRPSERLTCCTVLGELVAVGSTEGYIHVFNLRSNKLVFRADQHEQVQDMKLCVQGQDNSKIVLLATSVLNKCRIWDITSQKSLATTSGDVICAGYGYYCSTIFHDKIVVYDAMTEDCFPTRLFIKDFNGARGPRHMKYVSMKVNQNKLYFLSDNGIFCELNLLEISQSSNKFLYTPDVTVIGLPIKQSVYQFYLFNPCVAFCITDNGQLGISVYKSPWKLHNVFPFFYSIVSAIFYHVRLLVLGTDSGDVYLYFIKDELELKKIDFNSENSKRLHIASEPIVSVDIIEILGDQNLLVTTRSNIYHIRLD